MAKKLKLEAQTGYNIYYDVMHDYICGHTDNKKVIINTGVKCCPLAPLGPSVYKSQYVYPPPAPFISFTFFTQNNYESFQIIYL